MHSLKKCALAAALAPLVGCASVPPKVLVAQSFHGEDKNVETMIQDTGQADPASKQKLYNVMVRACNVTEGTATEACKDSTVLENVLPQSIY